MIESYISNDLILSSEAALFLEMGQEVRSVLFGPRGWKIPQGPDQNHHT